MIDIHAIFTHEYFFFISLITIIMDIYAVVSYLFQRLF